MSTNEQLGGVAEIELWESAAREGVHRIALPTPFVIDTVNAYLVEDEPLTLIDCGPSSVAALTALEDGLLALGRRIEDIELVLLTHQHVDHHGLAGAIVRRSGAEVGCIAPLAPGLEDFAAQSRTDDEYMIAQLRRHGVGEAIAAPTAALSALLRQWGGDVEVRRPLAHGDAVALAGRKIQVLHHPGHSPSDTVFWDADRRMLWTGDHLLSRVSSNPLIARPLGVALDDALAGPRPRALVSYMASLRATQALDPLLALGGHDEPVADTHGHVEARLRLHELRAEKVLELLRAAPSSSAYDVARQIWGDRCYDQAFLTVSEALAHVDVLIERGLVVEDADGPTVRFEAR